MVIWKKGSYFSIYFRKMGDGKLNQINDFLNEK